MKRFRHMLAVASGLLLMIGLWLGTLDYEPQIRYAGAWIAIVGIYIAAGLCIKW